MRIAISNLARSLALGAWILAAGCGQSDPAGPNPVPNPNPDPDPAPAATATVSGIVTAAGGTVIEGATDIGSECVIGPYSRIVESRIGRGAELKGWNYVARTTIRNRAILEPYVRRGFD